MLLMMGRDMASSPCLLLGWLGRSGATLFRLCPTSWDAPARPLGISFERGRWGRGQCRDPTQFTAERREDVTGPGGPEAPLPRLDRAVPSGARSAFLRP